MALGQIAQLHQERAELIREEQAILAISRGGTPTEAQFDRLGEIQTRIPKLEGQLEFLEAERDRRRGQPTDAIAVPDGIGSFSVPRGNARRLEPGMPGNTRYAQLFGRSSLDNRGFKSLDEYLRIVNSRIGDPRLMAGMTETVGSEGGFLVPEQFSAELFDDSLEAEIVRPRARIYPMTSDARKIGGIDNSTHASGAIYGFTSQWSGEGDTNTDGKAATRLMTLNAHKLALFANASNELAADGTSFEEQLGPAMRAAVGFTLDTAFFVGSGAGRPAGILTGANGALITLTKESGQAADTIVYENLVKMFSRHYNPTRAVWIANITTIPELLMLTQDIGTGGAAIPVLKESGGQFTILTRPVIFTEKVPVLGDAGDISLIDFSQYAVGLRSDVRLESTNAAHWHEDETDWRAIIRADGQSRWDTPLTPLNGSTLSWAVTLGARA